ncbi:hypothetical protein F5Y17DRAFT_128967 [Xylariaceae sp. FL0594]|nr:hypothetical protein F5Y17DRAFT_128967 [Xylariaceae sp. FL0594]
MSQPTEAQIAHQQLIDQLDLHSIHRHFRNPHWRPNQRRNKNIKTIIGDASRKEASVAVTPQANSGAATPMQVDDNGLSTSGTTTPAHANGNGIGNVESNISSSAQPNLAQASRSLSKLVLEKTLRPNASGATTTSTPSVTYTNVESAPSLAHTKRYCDITGLPAPYLDPKSRLRYHDKEVFSFIRSLPQGTPEAYLEARGAHTILK